MTEKVFCDNCTDKGHCSEYKAGTVCVNDRTGRNDEKMSKNELKAILETLRCAKEIIAELANDYYPYSHFKDADIEKMFYEINGMCIKLSDKIGALETETV